MSVASALALLTGLAPNATSTPAGQGDPGRTVVMLVTSGIQGNLEPCGCGGQRKGGLAGRLQVVRELRAADPGALLVDTGDTVNGVFRQDELKLQAAAMALQRLRYDAVGLGEADLGLGPGVLGNALGSMKLPVLCANLESPPAWCRTYLVHSRSGTRVALVGVTDPAVALRQVNPSPDSVLDDVASALRRLAGPIEAQSDLVVVLAHAPLSHVQSITSLFTKPCVVVAGHGEQVEPVPPQARPNGLILQPGTSGRYVLRVALELERGRLASFVYRVIPVTAPSAPEPEAVSFLRFYQSRLAAEDIVGRTPQRPLPAGQQYAGTEACRACHAAENGLWVRGEHARAYRTLTDAGREADPECVSCHTVGFGLQSGFAGMNHTPKLTDVGCESCHGPAAGHAADPKRKTPGDARVACATCHTAERSPKFDAEAYLPRIKHWKQ